jgi:lipoyl(octanoyl) transferase
MDFQWLGRITWEKAYALQESLVEQRLAGEIADTVLLLEHEPVITIGRTPDRSSLLQAEASGLPVIETNRGGQATYHGPGQLVGYLVLDLAQHGRDLHDYLRRIEEALILTCQHFQVTASRRDGLTGVWVANRKLASIGVGVRKWISMHGFALNVEPESLRGFQPIVPCGIQDVTMTCLSQEAARALTVHEVAEAVQSPLKACLTAQPVP